MAEAPCESVLGHVEDRHARFPAFFQRHISTGTSNCCSAPAVLLRKHAFFAQLRFVEASALVFPSSFQGWCAHVVPSKMFRARLVEINLILGVCRCNVIENHHTMWHVLVVACATPSDTESRACRCWTVTFAFRVAPCRNLSDSLEMTQANGTKVEWCRVSGAHVSSVDMEAGQARQRQRWPAARQAETVEAWTKCHG